MCVCVCVCVCGQTVQWIYLLLTLQYEWHQLEVPSIILQTTDVLNTDRITSSSTNTHSQTHTHTHTHTCIHTHIHIFYYSIIICTVTACLVRVGWLRCSGIERGPIMEMSSHTTRKELLVQCHLSSLNHSGLFPGVKEWSWYTWANLRSKEEKKSIDKQRFIKLSQKSLECKGRDTCTNSMLAFIHKIN